MSYTTQTQPPIKPKPYKSLLANRNMYTFKKVVTNDIANKQITAFTENYKNISKQQADAIRDALPTETTFGYVMCTQNQLTDTEIINAIRYNDSRDTHFNHFIMWYEVAFVFVDLHAKQIMCWGTNENVQNALEGTQELLHNAIRKKMKTQQAQQDVDEQLRKVTEQKRIDEQHKQNRLDEQNEEKHFYDKVDRIDYWDRMDYLDKDYMANKHS